MTALKEWTEIHNEAEINVFTGGKCNVIYFINPDLIVALQAPRIVIIRKSWLQPIQSLLSYFRQDHGGTLVNQPKPQPQKVPYKEF